MPNMDSQQGESTSTEPRQAGEAAKVKETRRINASDITPDALYAKLEAEHGKANFFVDVRCS